MSVQFGRWNFDGKPVDRDYLEKVKSLLAPYGPDDSSSYSKDNVSVLYRAFHTTKESRRETQPYMTPSRAILIWDGRLDNRAELIRRLDGLVVISSTDIEVVAAAYEYWGSDSFAMLIGDWALSIWDPHMRSLILAKDPIGTRHLYYSLDDRQVTWSTILDPLALFAGKEFALCEEYVAGYVSLGPAAHVTPYRGIHSVPPSSSVLIRPRKHGVSKYWDFDPSKRIRYRTDGEYEEHFRAVFAEAVRRRLRSDSPILAELSGGMDSSSIVCMADRIIARGDAETPRLDTLSYYDDSEPNWNERPYFTKVEDKRGRVGCHINLAEEQSLSFSSTNECFFALPGSNRTHSKALRELNNRITSQGNRVRLSGIGGDEVLGGVPTPIPELGDLFARLEIKRFIHQLKIWSLAQKRPWIHLFRETLKPFLQGTFARATAPHGPWLQSAFLDRNRAILTRTGPQFRFLGPLPSFQNNMATLTGLRNQLASAVPNPEICQELRYPYLDRNFLEFVFAIPREQLVRPGQRRSLMRRSLVGILPDEILQRRRKAFAVRGAMVLIADEWPYLAGLSQAMISSSLGIVDSKRLLDVLEQARNGQEVDLVSVLRTLTFEFWLRSISASKVLAGTPTQAPTESRVSAMKRTEPAITRASLRLG